MLRREEWLRQRLVDTSQPINAHKINQVTQIATNTIMTSLTTCWNQTCDADCNKHHYDVINQIFFEVRSHSVETNAKAIFGMLSVKRSKVVFTLNEIDGDFFCFIFVATWYHKHWISFAFNECKQAVNGKWFVCQLKWNFQSTQKENKMAARVWWCLCDGGAFNGIVSICCFIKFHLISSNCHKALIDCA